MSAAAAEPFQTGVIEEFCIALGSESRRGEKRALVNRRFGKKARFELEKEPSDGCLKQR
jgi:hypothetical protein